MSNKKPIQKSPDLITLVAEPRSAQNAADLAVKFSKELKKIELDDIVSIEDLDLEKMMQMIKSMKANRFVLQYEDVYGIQHYLVLDFEIKIQSFIAMRGHKLLGTGEYKQCATILLDQMRKEFPDKFKDVTPEMLDDSYIKNISELHFGNSRMYRIICCT